MFLCDDCHGPKTCWALLSRGPCEKCKKVAVCLDCHGHSPDPATESSKEETP